MSTVAEVVVPKSSWQLDGNTDQELVQRLRKELIGCRLTINRLPTSRALTDRQKEKAAEALRCKSESLSASRRLFKRGDPHLRRVNDVLKDAKAYWKSLTVPYVSEDRSSPIEKGLRLMRVDRVESFDDQMREFSEQLAAAVESLQQHYDEVLAAAREQLGDLFDPANYVDDVRQFYALTWGFQAVEPPNSLRRLHPELYREQTQKLEAKLSESAQLAIALFVEELKGSLQHVMSQLEGAREVTSRYAGTVGQITTDRDGNWKVEIGEAVQHVSRDYELRVTTGQEVRKDQVIAFTANPKPKAFRAATIGNVLKTLEYFSTISSMLGPSAASVDELVQKARQAINRHSRTTTLDPKQIAETLKCSSQARRQISEQFAEVCRQLDSLAIDRPRRHLMRLVLDGEEDE